MALGRFHVDPAALQEADEGAVLEGKDRASGASVRVEVYRRQRYLVDGLAKDLRLIGRLRHPNTLALLAVGFLDGDRLCVVHESAAGSTLAQALDGRSGAPGTLGVTEAARIAGALLESLGEAHALGIVHRRIHPALVTLGAGGSVKLRYFVPQQYMERDDAMDRTLQALGLAEQAPYLSPEVASQRAESSASDLYSVGCLLVRMLTGRPPFGDRGGLMETLVAQVREPAPDLRRLAPERCSPRLAELVQQLLEKDPAARPSAAATAEALRRPGPDEWR